MKLYIKIFILSLLCRSCQYINEYNNKYNIDNKKIIFKYNMKDSFSITSDSVSLIEASLWDNKTIGMIFIPINDSLGMKLGFSQNKILINKSYLKRYGSKYIEDGTSYRFDDNGNLTQVFTFKNGIFHGNYISYYENGMIEIMGYYINGEKTGRWLSFNRDGSKK